MFFNLLIRNAFNIAKILTPTSEKTAHCIPNIPNAVKNKTIPLIPKENIIFSFIIDIVRLDNEIANGIFEILSSISTTSDASIAATLPNHPIEIPTSPLERTGASLIPSPTNPTNLFLLLLSNNSSI